MRPRQEVVNAVRAIGAATASATLAHMGIRCAAMAGPVAWTKGSAVAGPALTLQFMPKREDLYGDGEYRDVEKQLHRHVLYHVERGDMVIVDARADMRSGVFGEMMLTLKEKEKLGHSHESDGDLPVRLHNLIDKLLSDLESRHLKHATPDSRA